MIKQVMTLVKFPWKKKYVDYVVKSGKHEIGNTAWKEGICDEK